jgi:hypothetical protein
MERPEGLVFVKHCPHVDQNCVEVAETPDFVVMIDSKQGPGGLALQFGLPSWRQLLTHGFGGYLSIPSLQELGTGSFLDCDELLIGPLEDGNIGVRLKAKPDEVLSYTLLEWLQFVIGIRTGTFGPQPGTHAATG